MTDTAHQSFFGNLWERRVPQYVATYFGVCFTIIQFLNFASERYGFDSSVIDKFITFCAVLLPALILFTYNHGRPGYDPITKLEKIFIPINFLIAAALAFFVSGVSQVKAAPTQVTITDEEGTEVSRMVPSDNQIKKLAFFPFGSSTNEEDSDWIKFGLPLLLKHDLEQDMRIYGRSPDSYSMELESNDYELRDKIPLGIKLDIAKNTLANFLVSGDVKRNGDDWQVDIDVHEVENGEVFLEQTFQGNSIFEVTDKISDQLHGQFFLKDAESDFSEFVDLPAEELITADVGAFQAYIQARELLRDNKHELALAPAQRSMQLDGKSPMIMLLFSQVIRTAGDLQSSQQLISDALKLSGKLTERNKFSIKQFYYLYNNDIDKFLSLAENWITLYPKDFSHYDELLGFYTMTNEVDKAKEVGKKAIANGHRRRVLTEMFDLSIRAEDYDEAEKYLDEYEKELPGLYKKDVRRGELYENRGEFDKSIAFYDKLLLDDPENGRYIARLASQYFHKGDIGNYKKYFAEALSKADRAVDSVRILTENIQTISQLGWKDDFLMSAELKTNCEKSYLPELAVMSSTFLDLPFATMAGAEDYYLDWYEELSQANPQIKPITECITGFLVGMMKRDIEKFKNYYSGQCKAMVLQGTPSLELMADGYIASMDKDYDTAISKMEEYIKVSGSGDARMGSVLAEQYRLKGKPQKAIELCQNYLKTYPNSPGFLFELCQSQAAAMDTDGATKTYKKLSKMWSDAHPDFIYYDDFKELGKQLSI